jgi:hypothetical protein
MNMSQHDRPPRISDIGRLATPALANGGVWAGRVVWLATPERNGAPVLDVKNVDMSLRSRPIMGLEILHGFVRSGEGSWRGGTIYSPRQGRSFPAEIRLPEPNRLEITAHAGLISKTVAWTRRKGGGNGPYRILRRAVGPTDPVGLRGTSRSRAGGNHGRR